MTDGEVRCLYQVIRAKSGDAGYGQCRKCKHDDGNKACRGYMQVKWWVFEVEDDKES